MIETIESVLESKTSVNEVILGVPAKNETEFLSESICALANHDGGGCIIYGIGSRQGFVPFRKNQARTEHIVKNVAENALTPEVKVRFESSAYEGNPILAVIVEPSRVKPVCIKDQTPLKAFYRINGETKLLSTSAIGRLMIETAEETVDTAFISKPWTAEEINSALSFASIKKALLLSDTLPTSEVLNILTQEDLIKPNGNNFWVKKLAVVLFKSSHISFITEEIPTIRLVVTTEETRRRGLRREHPLYIHSLAEAPEQILIYLKNELQKGFEVAKKSILKRDSYKNELVLPVNGITEIIINAACFTDFTEFDNRHLLLKIDLIGDTLNFSSKGDCVLSPDRIFDKSGECANPKLREWLRRIYPQSNFSDQKGFLRLLSEMEELRLPPPEFKVDINSFDVKVSLRPISSFQETSSKQRKLACYQHACLGATKHSLMTNRSLRQRLRADPVCYPRCSRIIAQLIKENKLVRAGGSKSKRDATYAPYWYRPASV